MKKKEKLERRKVRSEATILVEKKEENYTVRSIKLQLRFSFFLILPIICLFLSSYSAKTRDNSRCSVPYPQPTNLWPITLA